MNSMEVMAGLLGAAVAGGLVVSVAGLVSRARPPGPGRGRRRAVRLSRRAGVLLVAGLVGGLVAAAVTGVVVLVLLVPLVVTGLPWLLSAPPAKATIRRLEAMEEWTRSLASVLALGNGLEQAIGVTLRSVPEPIRPEVTALGARLRARWDTEKALRAFADDLDDATGDMIAANLVHAANQRNRALALALEATAEAVRDDVAARRKIEAGRAKPRGSARIVVGIVAVMTAFLVTAGGTYLDPYSTPLGQTVMVVLVVAMGAALWWLRAMAAGRPPARFLEDGPGQRADAPATAQAGAR
ncbi:MAG: type II secretion system F family protein [Micrococcales bacterium]|nr:type II secretion system F family protein [Micrococcales bacterium]